MTALHEPTTGADESRPEPGSSANRRTAARGAAPGRRRVAGAGRTLRHRRRTGGRATWPGTVVLLLVTGVGLLAFGWPFLMDPESGLAHGQDAPWLFAVLISLLGMILLAEQSSGRMDAKTVAVLGVLAALGAGLRVLSAGVAGLEPMFFLVILAGRVLGRRLAFLSGAITLLVSAFLTGGVGPWTPFQMIATGWVALGAACLPRLRGRLEVAALAAYGLAAGLAFGLVMNLWFWPFLAGSGGGVDGGVFTPGAPVAQNLAHYAVFYLATSLGYDLPRGVFSAVLIAVAGPAVLATLRRAVRAASFDASPTFAPARGLDHLDRLSPTDTESSRG